MHFLGGGTKKLWVGVNPQRLKASSRRSRRNNDTMNKLKKLIGKAAIAAVAGTMLTATLVIAQSTGSGSGSCSGSDTTTVATSPIRSETTADCPAGQQKCGTCGCYD